MSRRLPAVFVIIVGLFSITNPVSAAQTRKSPPLVRPTSQTQTPLTPQQAERHKAKIKAVQKTAPDTLLPTQERMTKPHNESTVGREMLVATVLRGDPGRKEVALTFDDGPHPTFTPRLLDLLKELHVRATFFLVGKKVDEAPYLVTRMVQEGHEVGNHTYHHSNLTKLPPELVEDEIRLDNDAIRRACGVPPVYFRPPGGQYNENVLRAAEKLKMTTVLWTDDPADYVSPGENVIEQRLEHIRNGANILLHDGIEQTLNILPDLIARLRRAGYKFVTLPEMAQHLENAVARK